MYNFKPDAIIFKFKLAIYFEMSRIADLNRGVEQLGSSSGS